MVVVHAIVEFYIYDVHMITITILVVVVTHSHSMYLSLSRTMYMLFGMEVLLSCEVLNSVKAR